MSQATHDVKYSSFTSKVGNVNTIITFCNVTESWYQSNVFKDGWNFVHKHLCMQATCKPERFRSMQNENGVYTFFRIRISDICYPGHCVVVLVDLRSYNSLKEHATVSKHYKLSQQLPILRTRETSCHLSVWVGKHGQRRSMHQLCTRMRACIFFADWTQLCVMLKKPCEAFSSA